MRFSNFNCTQHELYAVCTSGWLSCSRNLKEFSSFKPKYTQEHVQAKVDEVQRVSLMDDHLYRMGTQEALRLDLARQAGICLENWKRLELYIKEAWTDVEDRKSKLKTAGQPYYKDAYNLKWETLSSLMNSAEKFMANHADILKHEGSMADDFPKMFNDSIGAFRDKLLKFREAVKNSHKGSDDKTTANKRIYTDLMSMFADAKLIFRKDKVMMRRFTFDAVLQAVSGTDGAGIRGFIENGRVPVTEIAGLQLRILETGETMPVNEDGTFRFSRMPSGLYTLEVTAPGYKEMKLPVTVNTGAYSFLEVQIVKEDKTE